MKEPYAMLERPLTVAGLLEKRAELVKAQADLETELRAITCDIDHLDGAILLFDPGQVPAVRKRFLTDHKARSGQMHRFVLEALRTATGPVTSRQIAEAWASVHGLDAKPATLRILRRRVTACLQHLRATGTIQDVGYVDDCKGWRLAP
jgi:hypothetical protein